MKRFDPLVTLVNYVVTIVKTVALGAMSKKLNSYLKYIY